MTDLLVFSAIAAAAVCAFLYRAGLFRLGLSSEIQPSEQEKAVFLFEGQTLVDATIPAQQLISGSSDTTDDWHRLAIALSDRFENLLQNLSKLDVEPTIALRETKGSSSLIARRTGSRTRVVLLEAGAERPMAPVDHGLLMPPVETTVLRSMSQAAPFAMWKRESDGQISWANQAYLDLVKTYRNSGDTPVWPIPALFRQPDLGEAEDQSIRRIHLTRPNGEKASFTVTTLAHEGAHLCFATSADELVRAEEHLSNFVQTMTKTFADLPAGLAVFNRERQLTLFNPALTDLLQLDPAYLITRPRLQDFFDHLRENRKLPEPKNYRDWRERLTRLDTEAQEDRLRETWTLDNGLTYRVSGRPHADGALAFLVEDISSEVTLTRRFRQELDQSQSVLDGLEQAVAVFSPAGVLTQSNQAYTMLWETDPLTSLNDLTITDATRHWRDLCRPSPIWGEIRDFVHTIEERANWHDQVQMQNGQNLTLRCTPLSGGATMITFLEEPVIPNQSVIPSTNLVKSD
ncbi:PAS-domain containing protein [Actibacterium pelagium]|uniref:PAS-domain containing protein n=1 Tax=Actibacterium pelagium TaxID=2029103 RepID=UPI001177877A|nr:PAS-domain containing protein [Actibacterium pelagium]